MAVRWRIQLLGGLSAWNDNAVIRRFPTQKAANLFAYLVLYPNRSHAREELTEMLWEEDDPANARPRLSRLLYVLRDFLDTQSPEGESIFLSAGHRTVQINPDLIETDVAEFERLAAVSGRSPEEEQLADLQRAEELYRGELLPGFYEDWVGAERDRLSDMYGSVLGRLSSLAEQRGRFEVATSASVKLIGLDPLREEHHLSLIRLYGLRNQTSRAIAQYEKLERILDEELGEEPSLATKNLVDKIRTRAYSQREAQLSAREMFAAAGGVEAPRSLPLPFQTNRFFGREKEIGDAMTALRKSRGRLVTLVGLGGSGKTRLAIETAKRLTSDFPGSVWFVPLADIPVAEDIPLAIMRCLQQTAPPDMGVYQSMAAALRRRGKALLILDSFEHLAEIGGKEMVIDLLKFAPDLNVLVTSRYKMGVAGEEAQQVPPLNSPPETCSQADLSGYASIQLFVERAKMANPRFGLSRDNAEDVRALCAKLEGIPLAIELAAAWAQSMTAREMLDGIGQRFELLVSDRDDVPMRHRSLLTAIEHGRHLLPPGVSGFLEKLSIFEGGWTLAAAEYVCDCSNAAGFSNELLERSFIRESASREGGETRFEMLDTIREFASQQLDEKQLTRMRRKHAQFFKILARDAEGHGGASDQARWLARLTADHANLVAALRWCHESEQTALGLEIAIALQWYWEAVGPLGEGRDWLDRLLKGDLQDLPLELQASAIGALGSMAWRQGDYPFALQSHERCLELRRALDQPAGVARSLYDVGICYFRLGNLDRTRELIEESLSIADAIGDRPGAGRAYLNLGNVAMESGDYKAAKSHYEQSMRIERALGNRNREVAALNNLGNLAYHQKRYVIAAHYFEECLRAAYELGSRPHAATSLMNLGIVVGRQGQWARAISLIAESLGDGDTGGDHHLVACLAALARLAADAGAARVAGVLLGGVDGLVEKNRAPISQTDTEDRLDAESAILALIAKAEFEAALNEGRVMGRDGVLNYALGWVESLGLSESDLKRPSLAGAGKG